MNMDNGYSWIWILDIHEYGYWIFMNMDMDMDNGYSWIWIVDIDEYGYWIWIMDIHEYGYGYG